MEKREDKTRVVLRAYEKLVVVVVVLVLVFLTGLYFVLARVDGSQKSAHDFLTGVIINLIAALLMLTAAYIFYRKVKIIKAETDATALVDEIAERVSAIVAPTASIEIVGERELVRAPGSFNILCVDKGHLSIVRNLADLIRDAKTSIDMITWKVLHPPALTSDVKGYLMAIEKRLIARSKPPVTVRRLLWRPGHLDLLEKRGFRGDQHKHMLFRYWLPQAKDIEIPLMPCLIIDEKVVHFGLGYLGTPDANAITFRDPEVVGMFTQYFNFFWSNAQTIKEADKIVDMKALDQIRRKAISLDSRLEESGSAVVKNIPTNAETAQEPDSRKTSLWPNTASLKASFISSILLGAFVVGGMGFLAGFFRPLLFVPSVSSNAGPLPRIFITGSLGFVFGAVGGAVHWYARGRRGGRTSNDGAN